MTNFTRAGIDDSVARFKSANDKLLQRRLHTTKMKSAYLSIYATEMQIITVLMRQNRVEIIYCRIYLGKFRNYLTSHRMTYV